MLRDPSFRPPKSQNLSPHFPKLLQFFRTSKHCSPPPRALLILHLYCPLPSLLPPLRLPPPSHESSFFRVPADVRPCPFFHETPPPIQKEHFPASYTTLTRSSPFCSDSLAFPPVHYLGLSLAVGINVTRPWGWLWPPDSYFS